MSNTTADLLSPDHSPNHKGEKPGVRRLNNVPLYVVGGGLALFLLVIVLVALDRAKGQPAAPAPPPQATATTATFAKNVIGDHVSGVIPAADGQATPTDPALTPAADGTAGVAAQPTATGQDELKAPVGTSVPPIKSVGGDAARQPLDVTHARGRHEQQPATDPLDFEGMPRERQVDEATKRLQELKLSMFEKAVQAKSTAVNFKPKSGDTATAAAVPFTGGTNATREADLARMAEVQQAAANANPGNVTAMYQARLAALKAAGLGATAGEGDDVPAAGKQSHAGAEQFNGKPDRWKLDNRVEAPAKYELTAGATIIPAKLIGGINSALAGPIYAVVSENVYDTATSRHLLIPQGTKLYGRYDSDVVFGQARVLTAFLRMIFPDGKKLDIGSMEGLDDSGLTGFNDQVNNHYARIYGSAFLMSGITAGVAMSQPQSTTNQGPTARTALSESLGQQLGTTSAQIINKNLNIAPTLEIRPGYRFNIAVVKDLVFEKPYVPFDYKKGKQ